MVGIGATAAITSLVSFDDVSFKARVLESGMGHGLVRLLPLVGKIVSLVNNTIQPVLMGRSPLLDSCCCFARLVVLPPLLMRQPSVLQLNLLIRHEVMAMAMATATATLVILAVSRAALTLIILVHVSILAHLLLAAEVRGRCPPLIS